MEIVALLCSCGVPLLVFIAVCAGLMKVFEKAGQPGIMAFVPIYNGWLLITEVCKMEPKWFIFSLIPILNIYAAWMVSQELARKFGKSETYGMGIFFLGIVFVPMLGFSDAKYRGGSGSKGRAMELDDEEEEEEEQPRPKKKKRPVDDDE
jgi:hypothetical protein